MAAASIGGLIAILWRRPSHRTLCGLVSFAAGALLSVTVVEIIPEAVKAASWPAVVTSRGLAAAFASTAIGLIVFSLIGRYVYYVCPACAASATEQQTGYLRLGILLMIALGIHSTVDGIAIAASSETGMFAAVLVLFAVSYHKVPEGLALVSVARLAGYSSAKALGTAVLIELTTGLGAFLGLFALRSLSRYWLGVHLGLVAGSFLYIVGFALIAEMMEHERRSILAYVVLGFASIVTLALILRSVGIGG